MTDTTEDQAEVPNMLTTLVEVKDLPVGSLIRDERGKLQFRTAANGWVSTAAGHTATMYIKVPAELLYRALPPQRKE